MLLPKKHSLVSCSAKHPGDIAPFIAVHCFWFPTTSFNCHQTLNLQHEATFQVFFFTDLDIACNAYIYYWLWETNGHPPSSGQRPEKSLGEEHLVGNVAVALSPDARRCEELRRRLGLTDLTVTLVGPSLQTSCELQIFIQLFQNCGLEPEQEHCGVVLTRRRIGQFPVDSRAWLGGNTIPPGCNLKKSLERHLYSNLHILWVY